MFRFPTIADCEIYHGLREIRNKIRDAMHKRRGKARAWGRGSGAARWGSAGGQRGSVSVRGSVAGRCRGSAAARYNPNADVKVRVAKTGR